MNQDFALLATPANARRILLFRRICDIVVSPEIETLANQERLDEAVFDSLVCPYSSTKYAISQFLLDCGLRGVIQRVYHPEINPLAVLNVVRVAAPSQVVIATPRRRVWATAAAAHGLSVQIIGSGQMLEQRLEQVERRAALIIEVDDLSNHLLRNIACEFPRLILYDNSELERLIPWIAWARTLSPTLPHPLAPRLLKDVPAAWAKLPLIAFAPFYNVCIFPHLITSASLIAALEDDHLLQRTKHYSSLLSV